MFNTNSKEIALTHFKNHDIVWFVFFDGSKLCATDESDITGHDDDGWFEIEEEGDLNG